MHNCGGNWLFTKAGKSKHVHLYQIKYFTNHTAAVVSVGGRDGVGGNGVCVRVCVINDNGFQLKSYFHGRLNDNLSQHNTYFFYELGYQQRCV